MFDDDRYKQEHKAYIIEQTEGREAYMKYKGKKMHKIKSIKRPLSAKDILFEDYNLGEFTSVNDMIIYLHNRISELELYIDNIKTGERRL